MNSFKVGDKVENDIFGKGLVVKLRDKDGVFSVEFRNKICGQKLWHFSRDGRCMGLETSPHFTVRHLND